MNVRLHLGDCLDVLPRMPERSFSFVLTDPPYSRAGGAHTSRTNAAGPHSCLAASDAFWGHWFRDSWRAIAGRCKRDACGLVFTDYRTVGALESAIARSDTGWIVSQAAVWDRGSIGLGSPLRARYEMIAFARGPDFKWDGRKDIANVFQCPWPYGKHEFHPSEKPVDLLRMLLRDFARGGPVLDPFCGSGSTLVACRREGLEADGIEADPETAVVAANRLELRIKLFQDTVLRRDGRGRLFLMNQAEKGWASYAVPVESEGDAQLRYAIKIGEWSEDEHGPFAPAIREAA